MKIGEIIAEFELTLSPPLTSGGIDNVRILSRKIVDVLTLFRSEVQRGECADLEFKETLCFDIKKHVNGGFPQEQCFSDDVLHSTLKTICAFANTNGGKLLIGVSDRAEVSGLQRDFSVMPNRSKGDFDEWELYLRQMIVARFNKGPAVSSSVQITKVEYDGNISAYINVGRRGRVSTVKDKDKDRLYIRVGNRTIEVSISDIDEYYELRRIGGV